MTSETDTNDDRIDHDHPDGSPGSDDPNETAETAETDERAVPDEPAAVDELVDGVSSTFPEPPRPSDDAAADPDGVLTPADLERVAEQVRQLDEERVLVPTDSADSTPDDGGTERSPDPPRGRPSEGGAEPGRTDDFGPPGDASASNGTGRTGPTIEDGAAYAVDVTVRTDHGVAADSFRSNDVRTVFESLLRWYAERIDPNSDPETVVGVLLSASDLDVEVR